MASVFRAAMFGANLRAYASAALFACALLGNGAAAKDAAPASEDPVTEARLVRLASELRCLVCQNQTIADSNADLAVDLRKQLREMIRRGDSDQQIIDYMTARYGDFVLYRPPLKGTTAFLWFGPAVLLVLGIGALILILRKRTRMSADQFEPDPEEDEGLGSEGKSPQ